MASESEKIAKFKKDKAREALQARTETYVERMLELDSRDPRLAEFRNFARERALRNPRVKAFKITCTNSADHGTDSYLLTTIYIAYVKGQPKPPRIFNTHNVVNLFGVTPEDLLRGVPVRHMKDTTREKKELKGEITNNKPDIECTCLFSIRTTEEVFLGVLKTLIDLEIREVSIQFLEGAVKRFKEI